MRAVSGAAAAAGLLAMPCAGVAAPPGPTPEVSSVTVLAGPGPKVKSSWPADGAQVDAGVLALVVTFDQDMNPKGWSYDKDADAAFPTCLGAPRRLADKRTFVLLCTVRANAAYGVRLNARPYFTGADGRKAAPAEIRFHTGDDTLRNVHDALTAAGLPDSDEPFMRGEEADGAEPVAAPPASAGGG